MGLMPIFTNNPATPLKSSKMVKIDPNKNNLVSRQSQNFQASKKIKLLEKKLMVQMIPCVYSKFNLIFLKESSFYYLHLPSLFIWMNTTNASRLKWHLKSPSNKVYFLILWRHFFPVIDHETPKQQTYLFDKKEIMIYPKNNIHVTKLGKITILKILLAKERKKEKQVNY